MEAGQYSAVCAEQTLRNTLHNGTVRFRVTNTLIVLHYIVQLPCWTLVPIVFLHSALAVLGALSLLACRVHLLENKCEDLDPKRTAKHSGLAWKRHKSYTLHGDSSYASICPQQDNMHTLRRHARALEL